MASEFRVSGSGLGLQSYRAQGLEFGVFGL